MVDRPSRRKARTAVTTTRRARAANKVRVKTASGRKAKLTGRSAKTSKTPAKPVRKAKRAARKKQVSTARPVARKNVPQRAPQVAPAPVVFAPSAPAAASIASTMTPTAAPPALVFEGSLPGTRLQVPTEGAFVARGRRRRSTRLKFTRWLYSEDLYRELGVSPRSQALVCRGLRPEPDGGWRALIAAVPEGFFQARWVNVPSEVVVPVPRPKA
jgi:hypothetical protein